MVIDLGNLVDKMNLNLIYLGCLAAGLAYSLLLLGMGQLADLGHGIMGGDHGAGDVGGDGHVTINFMSPLSITTFVTGFGAFGLITRNALNVPPLPSVFWSAGLAAVLCLTITYAFFRIFVTAQSNTVVAISDVIGLEAEVIASIPSGGVGHIAYTTSAGRHTTIAKGADGAAIPSGRFVRIDRFVGSTALVTPVESTAPAAPAGANEGNRP